MNNVFSNVNTIDEIYQSGIDYQKSGNFAQAISCFEQVLASDSMHSGAWHFLGVVALIQKNYLRAREHMERALLFCNTNPVYYNNYGAVLRLMSYLYEAKTAFEKAISLNSGYADAWSNLGQTLFLMKDEDRSVEHALNQALALVPNHPDALVHLAELRNRQRRDIECAEILRKLLEQRPNDVELLRHISEKLASSRQYEEAANYLTRAADLLPHDVGIQQLLGIYYAELGEILKAKKQFRIASTFREGKSPWRWKHLGYCPIYFDNTQQIGDYWHQLNIDLDEAITENNVYDWRTLVYDGFTSSFHLPHHDKCCREVKEKFTQLFAPSFAQFHRPELKYSHRPSGKIRIGFLVTYGHEGGFLRSNLEIIKGLDSKRFEVLLFYDKKSKAVFRSIIDRENVIHVPFHQNFEETIREIQKTNCNIIYYWKVGADAWNFFLPMCRLAPIQFTSWGTHGTSGVHHIDYSLAYRIAEQEDAQTHYTEKLFLIDEAPAFHPRMQLPHPFSREKLGLPTRGAIYYCPHRLSKYHPDYDFYLKGILENDPDGRILLLLGETSPQAEKFKERMRRNIGNTLIKRMIFIPSQPPQRYHQLMAAATMILDSHVYSGGITAYDALSCGTPCVTQVGPLLVQRYPFSIYKAMGIEDAPIASNREEYINAAVRVGTDRDYHNHLSREIVERGDLVFERPNAILEFESFFEKILQKDDNYLIDK